MVLRKLDNHIQKNEVEPLPYDIYKNYLQMYQRLKLKTKTIKLLEENRAKPSCIQSDNTTCDTTPRYIGFPQNLKLRCIKRVREKKQLTEWGQIFANNISDRGLICRRYKELLRLNSQNRNNSNQNWARDLSRHFPKDGIQMAISI